MPQGCSQGGKQEADPTVPQGTPEPESLVEEASRRRFSKSAGCVVPSLSGGGFPHGSASASGYPGPMLSDSLSMGSGWDHSACSAQSMQAVCLVPLKKNRKDSGPAVLMSIDTQAVRCFFLDCGAGFLSHSGSLRCV